ncbi:MAG: ornithine cyclodeaminase family protein [Anaerolineae bacterium]
MLILNAADVRRALPMKAAIAAMKRAYAAFSAGRVEAPLRTHLPVASQEAAALFMPAFVQDEDGDALAVKVVSLFPGNPAQGLPLIHAAVLVLDAANGRPQALLEGGTLTAIRTGAASGAATDLLARSDSRVAAIFGAGVQSRTQLEAICAVRPIETVFVFDPSQEKAAVFADEMAGVGDIPMDVRVADSPGTAVRHADIICCATTATAPVFDDADLKPGVHINGVGSYTPAMQEIPAETVARARVVVDSRAACLAEAGDLIQPIQAGLFTAGHIWAELGEIVVGKRDGRAAPNQITCFKSVGIAVQDAVAAQTALKTAHDLGLGQTVAW